MHILVKRLIWFALAVVASLMPLQVIAQEQFSRDIEQISFVPKGQWIGGLSVSYSQSDQDNYQFLIFENLDGLEFDILFEKKL